MTKNKKTEITIQQYGQMLFGNAYAPCSFPEHWASIMDEALPYVHALVALNDKMANGGYEITGIPGKNGKTKLDTYERIKLARKKSWMVRVKDLVEGDLIWLTRSEPEMYIGEQEPCPIEFLKNGVSVIIDNWGQEVLLRLKKDEEVFRAPKDFAEKEDYYTSNEYWLEKADELGI